MTYEGEIASLRARVSTAQAGRARAEVEAEQAESKLREALAVLQTEFGVKLGDATTLLQTLEAEVDAQVEAVRHHLGESE